MLLYRVEALLLASDTPLTVNKLSALLPDEDGRDIKIALSELQLHYHNRGIRIENIDGGWQFRTAPKYADIVQQIWKTRPPRLSRSMLETLAIIAYRQPVTRAEIEDLRGVKLSSSMVASLQERGWVKVLGRKDVPGRPHLFGTGKQFLIDFGLNSLSDLPDNNQLLDEEELPQTAYQSDDSHAGTQFEMDS